MLSIFCTLFIRFIIYNQFKHLTAQRCVWLFFFVRISLIRTVTIHMVKSVWICFNRKIAKLLFQVLLNANESVRPTTHMKTLTHAEWQTSNIKHLRPWIRFWSRGHRSRGGSCGRWAVGGGLSVNRAAGTEIMRGHVGHINHLPSAVAQSINLLFFNRNSPSRVS